MRIKEYKLQGEHLGFDVIFTGKAYFEGERRYPTDFDIEKWEVVNAAGMDDHDRIMMSSRAEALYRFIQLVMEDCADSETISDEEEPSETYYP